MLVAASGIREGAGNLVDGVLPLVSALQAVAKIHPWLEGVTAVWVRCGHDLADRDICAVVVSAFQVVVELNMRRRSNDRKIAVLIGSMRDMMEGLRRSVYYMATGWSSMTLIITTIMVNSLETVPAEHARASSIKINLEELVLQTADDIKACASACDVYAKTRLLTKVLRSVTWDDLFKQYIELFERRRADFLLRISVHAGLVLEDAHQKLQGIDEKVDELVRSASEPSAEEQRLRAIVERNGGVDVVAADDTLLKEVVKADPRAAAGPAGEHESEKSSDGVAAVKAELLESVAEAVERNSEVFQRKFRLQEMKIMEQLACVAHAEGDSIIETVLDGPHNAIHNPVSPLLDDD